MSLFKDGARFLGYLRFFRRRGIYPTVVDPRGIGRLLILAPHPDDDVIGLGGLMALYPDQVAGVVYVTDGSLGDPPRDSREVAATRREEAKASAKTLGIAEERLRFLDFPDGGLADSESSRGAVLAAIEEVRPDALFLPFFTDNHPDHQAVTRIVAHILPAFPPRMVLWGYETWSPLVASHLVDITAVMDRKITAIEAHVSQLRHIDYREKIRGLNAYRSMTAGKRVRHSEAFFRSTTREYRILSGILT